MWKRATGLTCIVLILALAAHTRAQLLVYYQFNETSGTVAVDSSGKGNDGTLISANATVTTIDANWIPAGWKDGCLDFSGLTEVVIPATNFSLRSDAGSVIFWMNQPGLQGAINTIWWGGDNTTGGGFGGENEIHIHTEAVGAGIWQGGELSFYGQGIDAAAWQMHSDPNKGAAGNAPVAPIVMCDGQWHHVACTWGNADGNVKMYVDGRLLTQAVPTNPESYPLNNMCIGSMINESRQYFGLLDEFQLYGRPLTAEEVAQNAQGILALSYPAALPSPGDKVTEVPRDAVLTWMQGDTARKHNVYFGTSDEDVNAASPTDPRGVLVGDGQTAASHDPPGLLDYNETYYWRVDEIDAEGAVIRGPVWSFTAVNFLVVDDFERYNDTEGARVFESWVDGWETEKNSAVTGHIDPDLDLGEHYSGTAVFHKGAQSMPFNYDTNLKYAEATLTLEGAAKDWTADGIKDLSLWFIGYPAYQGGFAEDPAGTYTVKGAGADIWGAADQFHFAYKEMGVTATTTLIAKVESVANVSPDVNTHEYAKAGLMIRDDLDPNARYCALFVTPAQGVRVQYRQTAGSTATSAFEPNLTAPYWLKLERTKGGLVRAYHSPDGAAWTQFPVTTVTMAGPIYAGMAVTSHMVYTVCEGVFSNVSITGPGSNAAWTDRDVGIISNAPEKLYVVLNDKAVVFCDDPNCTMNTTWTEWRTPLQQFAGQGVNLADVSTITIGIGDKRQDTTSPGGPGLLYIDDVRLYRP